MKVAQLNDGVFVGMVEAPESPLEPGVFLIPAGAVMAEEPSVPEGKFAKYENNSWVLQDVPKAPEPEPEVDIDQILNQPMNKINMMEQQAMLPRVTREFMLAAFAAQAEAAGVDPLTNFAYRKVKELDDAIAALRSQL